MLLSDKFTSKTCMKVYYNGSYNMLPSVFLNIPTSVHLILVSNTCRVLGSLVFGALISHTQVLIFCYFYPTPNCFLSFCNVRVAARLQNPMYLILVIKYFHASFHDPKPRLKISVNISLYILVVKKVKTICLRGCLFACCLVMLPSQLWKYLLVCFALLSYLLLFAAILPSHDQWSISQSLSTSKNIQA